MPQENSRPCMEDSVCQDIPDLWWHTNVFASLYIIYPSPLTSFKGIFAYCLYTNAQVTIKTRLTLLDARNSMPLEIWKAAMTMSTSVYSCFGSFTVFVQLARKIDRRSRRKCSRLPCMANSMINISFFPCVQAPRMLMMFWCSPIWIMILISDARSLYSLSPALSEIENRIEYIHTYIILYLTTVKSSV